MRNTSVFNEIKESLIFTGQNFKRFLIFFAPALIFSFLLAVQKIVGLPFHEIILFIFLAAPSPLLHLFALSWWASYCISPHTSVRWFDFSKTHWKSVILTFIYCLLAGGFLKLLGVCLRNIVEFFSMKYHIGDLEDYTALKDELSYFTPVFFKVVFSLLIPLFILQTHQYKLKKFFFHKSRILICTILLWLVYLMFSTSLHLPKIIILPASIVETASCKIFFWIFSDIIRWFFIVTLVTLLVRLYDKQKKSYSPVGR